MITYRLTASALALAFTVPLAAQSTLPIDQRAGAPAPLPPVAMAAPVAPPAMTNAVLRAGTPVTLRLLEEVTTKKKLARVGQRIRLEVASPVEYNGVVVIPAGTPAEGEITEVRNKGMWGKSGHLTARALWARVGGRQVRLAGTFDDKGVTGTAGVIAAIAFVPIAGFFTTGTSAVLPRGGEVPAFLDEDLVLAFQTIAPAPVMVTVPAQVATTPEPAAGTQ
jgi:hypothetical protein